MAARPIFGTWLSLPPCSRCSRKLLALNAITHANSLLALNAITHASYSPAWLLCKNKNKNKSLLVILFENWIGWFEINVISDEWALEEGRNNYFTCTGITRPWLQAGACWVERKRYKRGSVACGSHLGLWINLFQSSIPHRTLLNFPTLAVVHARHVNYQGRGLAPDWSQQP